jgi:hypothetical protein
MYILTHEGGRDTFYNYPNNQINVGEDFGGGVLGAVWTHDGALAGSKNMATIFGASWRNYRWKVYTMVVVPNNL